MQIEDRTYFEEEQKMEATWLLIFILISSISMMAIAIAFLYNDNADWTSIGIVIGAILLSDGIMIVLFKTMKLNLAVTKKGLHYRMNTANRKNKILLWDEVISMGLRKSPASGYGKKIKFRYGEVYAMNLKQGIEFNLKNGKKMFFSLKDPDEFIRSVKKLELNLHIV